MPKNGGCWIVVSIIGEGVWVVMVVVAVGILGKLGGWKKRREEKSRVGGQCLRRTEPSNNHPLLPLPPLSRPSTKKRIGIQIQSMYVHIYVGGEMSLLSSQLCFA